MDYDLGYIDLEERTLQPLDNPFGPKVLPMCSVRSVKDVFGLYICAMAEREGLKPTLLRGK